jgi:hypothetical protein
MGNLKDNQKDSTHARSNGTTGGGTEEVGY